MLEINRWALGQTRCFCLAPLIIWAVPTLAYSAHRLMRSFLAGLCRTTDGQDIAEYAIMLVVILVIVIGMVRLIGSNANTVFSQVGSGIQ